MKIKTPFPYKIVITSAILLLSLIMSLAVFLQTDFLKNKLKNRLLFIASKAKVGLKIEKIEGTLPFNYILKNVEFRISPEHKIQINEMKFTLNLLALMQNELYFTNFKAGKAKLVKEKLSAATASEGKEQEFGLPFNIYFKNFTIQNFELSKTLNISTKGRLKAEKDFNRFFCDLKIQQKGGEDLLLRFTSVGVRAKNAMKSRLSLAANVPPGLISSLWPIDGQLALTATAYGPFFSHFKIFNNEKFSPDITGSLELYLTKIKEIKDEEIKLDCDFYIPQSWLLQIRDLSATGNFFDLSGSVNFAQKGLQGCSLFFTIKEIERFTSLLPVSIAGKSSGSFKYKSSKGKIKISAPFLEIEGLKILNTEGDLDLTKNKKGFLGKANFNFNLKGENAALTSNLNWKVKKYFHLQKLNLALSNSQLKADLRFFPNWKILGSAEFATSNFNEIKNLLKLPFGAEAATVNAKALFQENESGKQKFNIITELEGIRLGDLFSSKAIATIEGEGELPKAKGKLKIDFKDGKLHQLAIDSFTFTTSNLEENWPFSLELKGKYKEPLAFSSSGNWSAKEEISIDIKNANGEAIGQQFSIAKPFTFGYSKNKLFLTQLDLKFGSSPLLLDFNISKNNASFNLEMTNFPLDFLSLNPYGINFSGFSTAKANLSKQNEMINGSMEVNLRETAISSLEKNPLLINGNIISKINNDRLFLESGLFVKDAKIMSANVNLPVEINFFPFRLVLPEEKPLKAEIQFHGRIENLLDLVHIGTHHLEGEMNCELKIANTYAAPKINGFAKITSAFYENYATGTIFKNLLLDLKADERTLFLNLAAQDEDAGEFSAKGRIELFLKDGFPFILETKLKDFACLQKEWVFAKASGELKITGNKDEAFAKGSLYTSKAEFTIPEKFPVKIPNIPIVFLNSKEGKQKKQPKELQRYPIYLDLDLVPTDEIFVSGRGLDSRWNGSLYLSGTYENIIAKGDLSLTQGNFSIAGRNFELKDGSVIFPGIKDAPAEIDISGALDVQGNTIIVNLKGPINDPKLIFRSLPALPIATIMSLLIFGHDTSDISSVQASQLTTTTATLSDETETLTKTRKSLGLDKFSIISNEPKPLDESGKMAMQVGKYIAQGLIISVRQGTEEGTANGVVEVDLTHGFSFQAENQQEQEQGKFSIKWSHNF